MHFTDRNFADRAKLVAVPTAPDDLWAQELRHDLRQPLTAVRVLVEAVATTTGIPPEVAGVLEKVRQQTDWMVELLRSSESEQPAVTVVDLAEAIEGPCLALPEGVPYVVRFGRRDEASVLVDPVALKRSVWNLMDNARRAVANGGTVEVSVRRERHDAVLEVADSGPGFGGVAPHRGHGLVVVRRFAERFGGELSAGASSLGGAVMTLRLPLAFGGALASGQ